MISAAVERGGPAAEARSAGFAGLRVGLVGPLPPPAGGMANQTRQLAELLRAEGAGVDLVQTNAPYRPAWAGRVPVLRAAFRLLPYLLALWRAAGRCDLFHLMANSGWSWHLFAAPAIWIARLRGVPVVVNYRGGEAGPFMAKQGGIVGFSLKRAAALVVPSNFLLDVFRGHGFTARVVPNIVDLARFHPREAAAAGAGHVVVARNLEPIYDNATAIRAFALLLRACPGARLTLAGSGPERAALVALAESLGVAARVRFTGRIDRDEMAALIASADIALNPSLVDNTPNSVLEAMASGVPVVSTNVGGVPYIVKDGSTALLVDAGDAPAMAAAMQRLLQDGALWQRLSAAGVSEVRRYTWPRVAPLLGEMYLAALHRSTIR